MSTPAGLAIKRVGKTNFQMWQVDMRTVLTLGVLWRATLGDKGALASDTSNDVIG